MDEESARIWLFGEVFGKQPTKKIKDGEVEGIVVRHNII